MIGTATKKPVTINFCLWTGENIDEVMKFCAGNATYELMFRGNSEIVIQTLEDGGDKIAQHVANKGDFIIQGIKGEYYPCKPDIFEATYNIGTPAEAQGNAVQDGKDARPEKNSLHLAVAEAWANYERKGEVCTFEGQPMIYASTLEEIHDAAILSSTSAVSGGSGS